MGGNPTAWAYGSGWEGDWCQDVAAGENIGSDGDTDVGGHVVGDGDVNGYWGLDWDVDVDVDVGVGVDVDVDVDVDANEGECEEDGVEREPELEHDVSRSTR